MSMHKDTLCIGIFGLGTVGSGILSILSQNEEVIFQRLGKRVYVKTICIRDLSKRRLFNLEGVRVTDDPSVILNDPEIDIVVEVMGGENPAFSYIKAALENKKYVVTANKEVISKHKQLFFECAKKNGVDVYFEASVGGGIPIIRSLKVGYAANKIQSFFGILNGTTNYILTKMDEEKQAFESVLAEAQALGFAELDPTMDVSGMDVAYKLTILAAAAFKINVGIDDIFYEGIENIHLEDILYARQFGYVIKLLAIGKRLSDQKVCLKVHPTMVPIGHPLAAVRNEFNALFVNGNALGESMLYGKGAGSLPTASAVVADIIDIGFDTALQNSRRNLEIEFLQENLVPVDQLSSKFYLRLSVADMVGVLEKVTAVFGRHKVSVANLIQRENDRGLAELVIVTHEVAESNMNHALGELRNLFEVQSIQAVIRVGLDE